jgi:hypothetical protein
MNNVVVAVGLILLIAFAFSPAIKKLDNDCGFIEKTRQYDETVNRITYNHGFWEGNYCMIVTDKGLYSLKGKNCVINKVGQRLSEVYLESKCR